MMSIQRLTLISDPTDEFPKNANNSFKVRLPEHLSLPGAGWHASLMSLTVPDQGQSNAVIASDPHTQVIRFKYPQMIRKYDGVEYHRVETPLVEGKIELEDVMNTHQIVATGSEFWKRVMQELHNHIMDTLMKKQFAMLVSDRDERPIIFVKKNGMPRLTWKEDSLTIHGIAKKDLMNSNNIAMIEFYINLDIALKFGLLVKKTGSTGTGTRSFAMGPNMQYSCPSDTYDETTDPTGSDQRRFYDWEGENYVGVNYTSTPFVVND